MKNTAKSNRSLASQTASLLQLSASLENAFGAGVLTPQGKANGQGWTTEQLLNLAAAKSLFN
ncbi:MAG: hypothetical protein WBB01_07215, partial [Phormidesmis sp.]